jgi:hypothetical protein
MSADLINSMILLRVLEHRQELQGQRCSIDLCADFLNDFVRLN